MADGDAQVVAADRAETKRKKGFWGQRVRDRCDAMGAAPPHHEPVQSSWVRDSFRCNIFFKKRFVLGEELAMELCFREHISHGLCLFLGLLAL
jgi:hypothetical protein